MIDIENAKNIFREYVSNYDLDDGKIALKYNHILRVAEISKQIATSLGLPKEDIELAELIGIFHDIGRFEQVRRFNTFVDRDSINHGEYGVKILFEDGLIEKFNIDEMYYNTIRLAVINHNRKAIEEGLSEHDLLHCKIIRDSDKLDIYHVLLTDKTINTYGTNTLEDQTFSDEIVREFKEEHYLDYQKIQTIGDRWIAHMTYVYDFNFKDSYKLLREKDYIRKMYTMANFEREDTIKTAKEITDIANRFIDEKLV
ncbi:MAG: HD domain-containing protein [Clostridia bacterium]|nr:HD domain-containing protein [Clostridia bacterium]